MKVSFMFLSLTFTCISFGQIKIFGTVKQSDSSILSYVNIGIKLKNVGTISKENGEFKLDISEQFLKDTLTLSYVGFEELNVPVQLIVDSSMHVFVLKLKTNQLSDVIITNKQLRTKTIGTKSHNPFLSGTVESKEKSDIIEFAKFINVHNKTSKIRTVNIYLLGVNIDTATFRINFYNIINDLPGDKIIEKNILERMSVKKGWLAIDLTKENIIINQDFFVGFEFMPEHKLSKYSLSYGGQFGGSYIIRKSSLGNWEKRQRRNLHFQLMLLYCTYAVKINVYEGRIWEV